jgi:GMP synthase-like glutamine amidotransferase
VLGGSEFTPYGIVEYPQRRAMSLQSHPEFTPEYAAALIELRRTSKYTPEQADRALDSLRQPNDRERVGRWLAQFLSTNTRG